MIRVLVGQENHYGMVSLFLSDGTESPDGDCVVVDIEEVNLLIDRLRSALVVASKLQTALVIADKAREEDE